MLTRPFREEGGSYTVRRLLFLSARWRGHPATLQASG